MRVVQYMPNPKDEPFLCASGLHVWYDEDDRKRCCNGYARCMAIPIIGLSGLRHDFPSEIEHVTFRGGVYRGWKRDDASQPATAKTAPIE